MESELLRIFNEQGNEIGTAPRSEVHKEGHWHETFHCWFTERVAGEDFIYFQKRSSVKKDYPDLLDITAAGHILANEEAMDGLREVKEELGIEIKIEELYSLGIIKDTLKSPELIDNEMCHVYVYNKQVPYDRYKLQREEVSGIIKMSLDSFIKLWFGEVWELEAEGFTLNTNGQKQNLLMKVRKDHFVPHEDSYISSVVTAIKSL
jgi:isopentenyldiphosphate isomerase